MLKSVKSVSDMSLQREEQSQSNLLAFGVVGGLMVAIFRQSDRQPQHSDKDGVGAVNFNFLSKLVQNRGLSAQKFAFLNDTILTKTLLTGQI